MGVYGGGPDSTGRCFPLSAGVGRPSLAPELVVSVPSTGSAKSASKAGHDQHDLNDGQQDDQADLLACSMPAIMPSTMPMMPTLPAMGPISRLKFGAGAGIEPTHPLR